MQNMISVRKVLYISQMIYRINSQTTYEGVAETALKQLQALIPFTKGIIFQIKNENETLKYSHPVVLNQGGTKFDEDIFMCGKYSSVWELHARSPWSSTFRQTDIREEGQFLNSVLYQDIYVPQNIYYGMHCIFVHRDCNLALLGLFRSKSDGDFSSQELFFLELISNHLEFKLYELLEGKHSEECRDERPRLSYQYAIAAEYDLTSRESEIIGLLYTGKSNQEIAELLYISKSKLDKHLHNIYRKMGVNSRTKLINLINERQFGLR